MSSQLKRGICAPYGCLETVLASAVGVEQPPAPYNAPLGAKQAPFCPRIGSHRQSPSRRVLWPLVAPTGPPGTFWQAIHSRLAVLLIVSPRVASPPQQIVNGRRRANITFPGCSTASTDTVLSRFGRAPDTA